MSCCELHSACPDGCGMCHEDATSGTLICDECLKAGFVQDSTSPTGECLGKLDRNHFYFYLKCISFINTEDQCVYFQPVILIV